MVLHHSRAGELASDRTNYWRGSMATSWTTQRRARQAALIRTWQPWERSTGPKSPAGKAASANNAFKGGHGAKLRALKAEINALLRTERDRLAG